MKKEFRNYLYGMLSWVVGAGVFYLGGDVAIKLEVPRLGSIISLMIASRVGMAIYYMDINGRISSVDNINYFVWLLGISFFLGLSSLADKLTPLWLAIKYRWIDLPIGFFLLIGIWLLMAQWRRNALEWLVNGGFVENKRELELIKKERAEENKFFEMIENQRTKSDLKSKSKGETNE